jgi:hypothetical protein
MASSIGFRFLAACLGMGMLVACGADPGTSPAVPATGQAAALMPVVTATPTPKPTAKPTAKKTTQTKTPAKTAPSSKPTASASTKPTEKASPTPAPKAADAMQALSDLKQTLDGQQTTQSWNTVTDNKKDGSKTVRTKSLTRTQAPGSYRLEVLDSTNSTKVGSKAVFTYGDRQVKVKPGGVLGIVTLTLPMSDEKALSLNGWQVNQFVVKGVLDRLTGGGYDAAVAGTTTVSGTELKVLKVTSAHNTLDADIAYELIGYDAEQNVRLWAVYGKPSLGLPQDLMYQLVTEKIEVNVNLAADTFKL